MSSTADGQIGWFGRSNMQFNKSLIYYFVLAVSIFGVAQPVSAKSLAVIIGNSKYQNVGMLDNPSNDAKLIAGKLSTMDFEVRTLTDLNEGSFRNLVKQLSKDSQSYDSTLIYYAGHAVQLAGENYLLPVDLEAPRTEEDVKLSAINMQDLLAAIRSRVRVLILDACRDNPLIQKSMLPKGRGLLSRGLAPPSTNQVGTFVAYATDAGNIASDGSRGNSPFALALAENIENKESIDDMFSRVTKKVLESTNGAQRPFKYASLDERFCLPGPCNEISPSSYVAQAAPNTASISQPGNSLIKLTPEAVFFYSPWVTYAFLEKELYQFDPRSVEYEPNGERVKFVQRVAYKAKGLAWLFNDYQKFTINSIEIDCNAGNFWLVATGSFDSDEKLVANYSFADSERKIFKMEPGSIAEAGHKLFCGHRARLFSIVPGTVSNGLVPFGSDRDGSYWWKPSAKLVAEEEHIYAVLFRYSKPDKNKITNESLVGQIIFASASCSDRKKARIIRRLFVDENNKITGLAIQDEIIDIYPNSVGENILKVDCK